MTKGERRYLRRFVCALCEQPLDRDWCGAIYDGCSEEVRAKRRIECLKGYRPRVKITRGEP